MRVHIQDMRSTVRVTDATGMLSELLIERLAEAVACRIEEKQAAEQRASEAARLRPRVCFAPEGEEWS